MSRLDEVVERLEDYLNNVLSKEKLSKKAEHLRKRLIEELEISKLPPSLPPRPPEGLKKPEINDNNSWEGTKVCEENNVDVSYISEEEYADVDIPGTGTISQDNYPEDTYEDPVPLSRTKHENQPDYGSGTDYESYTDDSDEDNDRDHVRTEEDIKLPSVEGQESRQYRRLPSEKKKKKEKPCPLRVLQNITYKGELFYLQSRFLWKFAKRICVISDNRLVVYKKESDETPVLKMNLHGYVASYSEKEGRFNHVLNLTHPTNKDRMFHAESKSVAEIWLRNLIIACNGGQTISADTGVGVEQGTLPQNDDSAFESLTSSITLSSSTENTQSSVEGGSGDGVMSNITSQGNPDTISNTSSNSDNTKVSKDSSKGIMSSLKNFTFGRKKGKDVKAMLEVVNFELDPDVTHAGYVMLMSEFYTSIKKWTKHYCLIKNKTLESYKEKGQDSCDISLPLGGVQIDLAELGVKHQLAFKLVKDGITKLYMEPPNTLEQGTWLSVLVKETGCGSPKADEIYADIPDNGEGDGEFYNDVYDHTQLSNRQNKIAEHKDTPRRTPPPLPLNPPPIRTPPSVKRTFGSSEEVEEPNTNISETDEFYDDNIIPNSTTLQPNTNISEMITGEFYDDVVTPNPTLLLDKINSNNITDETSIYQNQTNNSKFEYDDTALDRHKTRNTDSDDDDENNNFFGNNDKEYGNSYIDVIAESPGHSDDIYEDFAATPKKQVGDMITRLKNKLEYEANKQEYVTAVDTDQSSDVIKCHSGPSIAEDVKLLKDAKNPLLNQIRMSRAEGAKPEDELEKLKEQIFELKSNMAQLRKQRTELRSKKLLTRKILVKEELEVKLQDIDKELEETEKELTKLQVLAQEQPTNLSRNSSLNSPRSTLPTIGNKRISSGTNKPTTSRNNSFNSKDSNLVNTPKSGITASRVTPRKSNIVTSKVEFSVKDNTTINKTGATKIMTGTMSSSKNEIEPQFKNKAAVGNLTSVIQKSMVSDTCSWKKNVPGNNSTVTTKNTGTLNKTKGSTARYEPKFTARTQPSVRDSSGFSSTTQQKSGNSAGVKNPSINQTRVQDRLKLWESKADDSNC